MPKTLHNLAIFVACSMFLGYFVAALDTQEKKDAIEMASAAASQADCKLDRDAIVRDIRRYRAEHEVGWAESAKDVATSLVKNCGDNS